MLCLQCCSSFDQQKTLSPSTGTSSELRLQDHSLVKGSRSSLSETFEISRLWSDLGLDDRSGMQDGEMPEAASWSLICRASHGSKPITDLSKPREASTQRALACSGLRSTLGAGSPKGQSPGALASFWVFSRVAFWRMFSDRGN